MARYARVESIDALQSFKVALVKFTETAAVALTDADSEVTRTLHWLENEQLAFWQTQVRKRTELVERAREAVRSKKYLPDAFGRQPSAVDEEKALRVAMARLEEAQQKLVATRRYAGVLKKEIENYKGGVHRMLTQVEADLPAAVAHLSGLLASLREYVAAGPASAASQAGSAQPSGAAGAIDPQQYASMARAEPAEEEQARPEPPTQPKPDEEH